MDDPPIGVDEAHRASIDNFSTLAYLYGGLSTLVLFVLLFGINLYVWTANRMYVEEHRKENGSIALNRKPLGRTATTSSSLSLTSAATCTFTPTLRYATERAVQYRPP